MDYDKVVERVGKGLEAFAADSRVPVFAAWAALSLSEVVAGHLDGAQTKLNKAEGGMDRRYGPVPEDFQPKEWGGQTRRQLFRFDWLINRLQGGADSVD